MSTAIQTIVDGLSRGSLTALTVLGIVLVFGIMRLVNFAHGEFILVGCLALVFLWPVSPLLATVAALVLPMLTALAAERLAFRPARAADHSTLLVTSFALSFLLQNLSVAIFGSATLTVDILPSLSTQIEVAGVLLPLRTIVVGGAALALLCAVVLFISRSRMGLQMRAAATDFEMARMLGVPANRVIAVAFALSGLLAGGAALAVVSQAGTVESTIGVDLVLMAFTAAVLGGMYRLGPAIAGAFAVGMISVCAEMLLPAEARGFRDAVIFGVVILVLLFRPEGLFVRQRQGVRI